MCGLGSEEICNLFGYYIVGVSAPNLPLHLSSGVVAYHKAVSYIFQVNTICKNDSPSLTRILFLNIEGHAASNLCSR